MASKVQPALTMLESDVAELQQRLKLGYIASDIPQPVTNTDVYLRAILIELRAIRQLLTKQNQ